MFYSPFNLKASSLMLYSPFNLKRSSIMFYSPFNLKTRQINIYQVSESKHGSGCSGEKDKHRTPSTHVYRDTGVYEENCMGQGLQRVPYRYYMYIVHPYNTLLWCLFVCLSVCIQHTSNQLNQIDGAQICVGPHMTPEKVDTQKNLFS